jgi:hypothetical protein
MGFVTSDQICRLCGVTFWSGPTKNPAAPLPPSEKSRPLPNLVIWTAMTVNYDGPE